MRNLKRALSLALASVMLLGMMVVGSSAAFTDQADVNNTESVALVNGLEIMVGNPDGSFAPDKVVTRAEAAVIIAKILHGSDINPSNFAGTGKFTDVPAWAEGWVNLVSSLGIIRGYGDGKFGPNDNVTLEQLAVILWNYSGNPSFTGTADSVGTHSGWAANGLAWALENGILANVPYENVTAGATRAQTAQMLMNYLTAN